MEAATERRDLHLPRMPLDNVLVELRHDGFDESFEADGLNVGPGGLSMRAAILPDVGTRLHCRFRSPDSESPIDANAEVVWAEDSGPHVGEFGLRFTTISDHDQESLERAVGRWHSDLIGEEESTDPGSRTVTLRLQGVAQPVAAELVHRSAEALVSEQRLPFLKIGTLVEDDTGRRGELQAVDLRLDDDVPRLVLTVWYDEPEGPSTLAEASEPEPVSEALPEPIARRERPVVFSLPDDDEESCVAEAKQLVDDESVEDVDDDASLEGVEAPLEPSESALTLMKAKMMPKIHGTREWLVVCWSRLAPLCLKVWRRGVRHGRRLLGRVRPMAKVLLSRVRRPRTSRPKRRQTRSPRRSTTRPGGAKSKAPEPGRPRKNRRRLMLLGLATILGGGSLYVFSDDAEAATELDTASPEQAAASPAVETPEPEPALVSPAPQPAPAPQPTASPQIDVSAEDIVPRALPEPQREAGRMPAPEFPTLESGTRPQTPPGSVPSDSPMRRRPNQIPPPFPQVMSRLAPMRCLAATSFAFG